MIPPMDFFHWVSNQGHYFLERIVSSLDVSLKKYPNIEIQPFKGPVLFKRELYLTVMSVLHTVSSHLTTYQIPAIILQLAMPILHAILYISNLNSEVLRDII